MTPPHSSPLDPLNGFFFKKHTISTYTVLSTPTTRVALKSQLFQLLTVGAFLKTNRWDVTREADRRVLVEMGEELPRTPCRSLTEALRHSGRRHCKTPDLVQGLRLVVFQPRLSLTELFFVWFSQYFKHCCIHFQHLESKHKNQ